MAPTFSYSGVPSDSAKDTIRFYLGDTDAVMILSDEEIEDVYTSSATMLDALLSLVDFLLTKSAAMPATSGLGVKWADIESRYVRLKQSFVDRAQRGALPDFGQTPSASGSFVDIVVGVDPQEVAGVPPIPSWMRMI